ncbi:UNVERIFIED_CONTAM: dinuclear metal center YbgI/SA1388 family protein [Williamsia faeni]
MTGTGTTTLAEMIAILERAYPIRLAESWDSVGLVCGDPDDTVTSVLCCVDVTDAVVDQALDSGTDLVVAHHPLLLRGVDTVGTHTPKGRLIHRLIKGGCALYTAHTNADSANPGVSDALAGLLGLTNVRPLDPKPAEAMDKWSVFVPGDSAAAVRETMFGAGAGEIGDYSHCCWSTSGTGQFLPGAAADPAIGERGEVTEVAEDRVEMVANRRFRSRVLTALRTAHPYEEPAFDLIELAPARGDEGLGRVGELGESMTLAAFTTRVAQALPTSAVGIRAAGDPETTIKTVAVCGGAGDSMLATARAVGADVYVTGDLRHHPVDEHLRGGGPALIDAGHWSTEFPWCQQAADLLAGAVPGLVTAVFSRPTDPWTIHRSGQ